MLCLYTYSIFIISCRVQGRFLNFSKLHKYKFLVVNINSLKIRLTSTMSRPSFLIVLMITSLKFIASGFTMIMVFWNFGCVQTTLFFGLRGIWILSTNILAAGVTFIKSSSSQGWKQMHWKMNNVYTYIIFSLPYNYL